MWRQFLTSLFPDALTRTYCVPPVHFNREQLVSHSVPGTSQPALVPPSASAAFPNVPPAGQQPNHSSAHSLWTREPDLTPVPAQDSDLCNDFALNRLLFNLEELGRNRREPMFILSEFSYGSYLNQPVYAAAVAAAQLPMPSDLPWQSRRGDFDILSFNRHHAVLIGELKAVGSSKPPTDAQVADRVSKAVKQLDKSEAMVKHLVKDIAPGLLVRKTICLPFVSSAQLQQVLSANQQLEQAVCSSLVAADAVEATQLCICSQQLSDPDTYWDVTPTVLSQLTAWWQRRMACQVDPCLNDQLYLDIVARFVGPASTVAVHCSSTPRVQVRTEGEAVQELGRRLARLVLTLPQLDLMHRDPPRVFLNGPPGTGKTLLLVLQGLRWLGQGHDVYVVSYTPYTLVVSYLIKYQLEMTLRDNAIAYPAPGSVYLHQYDFLNSETDVTEAITALSKGTTMHVLVDEANFDPSYPEGQRLTKLVTDLSTRVPKLRFWAASVSHKDVPGQLKEEILTAPLRSAPVVLREVQQGLDRATGEVHKYTDRGVAAPGDGLRVVELTHAGADHTGPWPHECPKCGKEVAKELGRLGVGQAGKYVAYSDVFVVTRSRELKEEKRNDKGLVTSPASGVVEGLRDAGMPVGVLESMTTDTARWSSELADAAEAAKDQVTVAVYDAVRGLERKVVVMLSGRSQSDDEKGRSDEVVDAHNRVVAMSRCTTQLITVTVPSGP